MVFSTACSKNVTDRLRYWLLLLAFVPIMAWAAEIDVVNPQITAGEDAYLLSADFRFELSPRLEEAVTKGVVLYFVVEYEMTKARWYWLDEKLVSRSLTYSLAYHALTRQYRLSTGGGLQQPFPTLTEALAMLSRLRNWAVIERSDKAVRAGEPYLAGLRLRLDINQLPRPFQISALGNKDWSLAADWKTWQVTLPPLAPVPVPVPVAEAK